MISRRSFFSALVGIPSAVASAGPRSHGHVVRDQRNQDATYSEYDLVPRRGIAKVKAERVYVDGRLVSSRTMCYEDQETYEIVGFRVPPLSP